MHLFSAEGVPQGIYRFFLRVPAHGTNLPAASGGVAAGRYVDLSIRVKGVARRRIAVCIGIPADRTPVYVSPRLGTVGLCIFYEYIGMGISLLRLPKAVPAVAALIYGVPVMAVSC